MFETLFPLSLDLCFASSVPLSPVNGREKQLVSLEGELCGAQGLFFPVPFTGGVIEPC